MFVAEHEEITNALSLLFSIKKKFQSHRETKFRKVMFLARDYFDVSNLFIFPEFMFS